jgi:OOP family OmpA-OmpF porin
MKQKLFKKNYSTTTKSAFLTNNELITSLINGGYVAVYFDDKSTPTNVSTEGTDFILTYLRNNLLLKLILWTC